ncbi:hypothetical protein HNQ94_001272 [Salirhabdus euzebyi]|uniref:Uncharacterized protein n=1 Tax=Salirhabdus euzebyi TaxID=394506 RepID=A0A841PYP0_9BACI|nr:hypothetical protein [Salirhabdus euzebyi]
MFSKLSKTDLTLYVMFGLSLVFLYCAIAVS